LAELAVEGDELIVRLSALEKVEGLHGDLRMPASAVQGVEVLDDAVGAVQGWRAPGTGVPGVLAVGTYRQGGKKTFAVVHGHTRRGVRVRLAGAAYDELIVGCADPEAVAKALLGNLGR